MTRPDEILRASFGFEFPAGFFRFQDLLRRLAGRGLSLGDPPVSMRPANVFGVFEEGAAGKEPEAFETRFYKDPPELVTLLLGDTDGLHWGYYVEDPRSAAFPVAHYFQNDAFVLTLDGDLFAALVERLKTVRRTTEENLRQDPAHAADYRQDLARLDRIEETLEPADRAAGAPERRVTAKTRDGAGIVVPPEAYRPLAEPDPFLKWDYAPTEADVRRFSEAALKAQAEGFPGTALKLGKDLWDFPPFFAASCELLDAAYTALEQPLLRERLKRARDFRKKIDLKRAARGKAPH